MNASEIQIRQATLDDLDVIVPMFDAYRVFYRKLSDQPAAKIFLRERMERNESAIFLSLQGSNVTGFTQLYPTFSSGAMAPVFILNDLFVNPNHRGRGTASALLQAAAQHAQQAGAVRLVLSSELSNTAARSVYERNGWTRDTIFCVYQLSLPSVG